VREFAVILTQRRGQDLDAWISEVRVDALSGFESFLDGLDNCHDASVAGVTLCRTATTPPRV
jgi:type VI protein secretion system component VasK